MCVCVCACVRVCVCVCVRGDAADAALAARVAVWASALWARPAVAARCSARAAGVAVVPVPFAVAPEMGLRVLAVDGGGAADPVVGIAASGYVPPEVLAADTSLWPRVGASDTAAAAAEALGAVRALVVGIAAPRAPVALPAWVAALCVALPRLTLIVMCGGPCEVDAGDAGTCDARVGTFVAGEFRLPERAPATAAALARIPEPAWTGVSHHARGGGGGGGGGRRRLER